MKHRRRSTTLERRSAAWHATRAATWNFTAADATKLQKRLLGRVVTPSDGSYPVDRQAYVPNFQYFPQMIVYCEVERDAKFALAFAQAHNLGVVVRSSGHSTAGFSVNNGMVIDVSSINDVYLDPDRRHVTVGSGTTFGKLNAVLASNDLHVPGGGCSEVCVAGYMQGGGYGLTSLLYGMNCDRVVSMRVLLASGEIVTVDSAHEPDLFWALRGGRGNNFGVLLQVSYELVELGALWGFDVNVDLERAPDMLALLETQFAGSAVPDGLGFEAFLTDLPTGKWLSVRGVIDGDEERGMEVIQPLLDVGGVQRLSQTDTYEYLNTYLLDSIPLIDDGSRTVTDSRYVAAPAGAERWADVCRLFADSPNTGNFIGFEPYGGAINEIGRMETAFVHRDALFDVFTWVFWFDDDEEESSRAWLHEFREIVSAIGNGEAYQNYPNRENNDYAQMYWAEAYPRLQDIRKHYDPDDVFAYLQSVKIPSEKASDE